VKLVKPIFLKKAFKKNKNLNKLLFAQKGSQLI